MSEQPISQEKSILDEKQFVVFGLARETYGIDINLVREIINMQELTAIPKSAEYIKGIINLRGRIIPVFDLAGKFMLESKPVAKSTRIVVVEVRGLTVGMIVDVVSEVLMIPAEVIEQPTEMMVTSISEQFVKGIAKYSDRLVIILNLEKVLINSDMDLAG
ncbi:MAG: chemotaxis protein CheW [Firmicutes bacterium HGW-Firmicutes-8]|nr:MAG: chemotaxis protein CheW [Firmicutes bacterium HGW-Firmicutes-8]